MAVALICINTTVNGAECCAAFNQLSIKTVIDLFDLQSIEKWARLFRTKKETKI